MENKNVLLSIKNLEVKFNVRGRVLTAIRGITLDIYEDESIAIVGESGSGKSVFTKTFAGMLDSNGFISNGDIVFNDKELIDTVVPKTKSSLREMRVIERKLNDYSKYKNGASIHKQMIELQAERLKKKYLTAEEKETVEEELNDLNYQRTELFNLMQTFDSSSEKTKIHEAKKQMVEYDLKIKQLKKTLDEMAKTKKHLFNQDVEYRKNYIEQMAKLKLQYKEVISSYKLDELTKNNNAILAKEFYLSLGRYDFLSRIKNVYKLLKVFKTAFINDEDINDESIRNSLFDKVVFRVKYLDETDSKLHGECVINLAKVKYPKDWQQIRGKKIATVFQDPMTSLNPIIPIGKQITSIILKHQKCSEVEARRRAIELMIKVGIPNAENRFDEYPFQYSGGMRQRIVIAIALSCQPKILICDEPTTALDVTIQAQILKLIKDLQKEFHYTIVFITHDLGVVANVAERVAVLYAGQIVELGTVDEIFYEPRHPYTWSLLSSLPQLALKNTELYSITGTPPSLYNKIIGDPFAPRNPYCLKIDTVIDAPMFKISDTHYAKTWLLDPRAPKIDKPKIIEDIHGKLIKAFNVTWEENENEK